MRFWKPIPSMPYEASDDGQIRSRARVITRTVGGKRISQPVPGKVLSPSYMEFNGKPSYVTVKANGKTLYVHRLVCMAWHGLPPPDCECNHKNGNSYDNRAENLEWITHAENIRESYRVCGSKRRPPAQPGKGRRINHGHRSSRPQ